MLEPMRFLQGLEVASLRFLIHWVLIFPNGSKDLFRPARQEFLCFFAAMVLVLTGCPDIRVGQLGRFFPTQLVRQVIDLLSPQVGGVRTWVQPRFELPALRGGAGGGGGWEQQRREPGFNLGSTWVQPRCNLGSTQVQPRFNPGSTRVQNPGQNPGSTWVQPGLNPGSTQVQPRFDL